MKTKLGFILLTVLTIMILAGMYLIGTDSYPALVVNWRPISAAYFRGNVAAAIHYYTKASELYGKNKNLTVAGIEKEIERAVLDKLIEENIIDGELKSRMSGGDLKDAVTSKINSSVRAANITQQVESIYGLSSEEFKDRVLIPEAEKEILIEKFFSGNNSQDGGFGKWLSEAKSHARVVILISGYDWNGQLVSIK